MLELRGLSKRFGDFSAVSELSFSVGKGELFALLGPNGAGKTTSMRMLMGFLKPSSGSAEIDGIDCFKGRVELKRKVGYLPDEPVFYDYLRGRELVRFVGEMHGLSREAVLARSLELVELLELGDAMEEFAVNFSRGMKKKLALVCATLHQPKLLILDEPTSGLDPRATRRLNDLIRSWRDAGTTIILSSHLLDQVERLADRMAIIDGGKLAAVGTLAELKESAQADGSLEDVFFSVTADRAGSE